MEALERLKSHVKTRLVDLRRAKKEGEKSLGMLPGVIYL